MAGIGFRLQALLVDKNPLSKIKAYLFGGIIAAGPWLISILITATISTLQIHSLSRSEMILFQGIIVYSYAASLILFSPFQLCLTRYLADLLYEQKTASYIPSLVSAIVGIGVLVTAIELPFCLFGMNSGILIKTNAFLIGISSAFLWIAMVFVSALKEYRHVVLSWATGAICCVIASLCLDPLGLVGYLIAFQIGQSVTLALLVGRIMIEFPSSELSWDFNYLRYMSRFSILAFIGFFYNAGIWIDKVIMWYSHEAGSVSGLLHYAFIYDTPVFFATLTVIPTLTLFLVEIETTFYMGYQGFFHAITTQKSLQEIRAQKTIMINSLKKSLLTILKVQGVVTFSLLFFSTQIAQFFRMAPIHLPVLRVYILGSAIQACASALMITLFYFEYYRLALLTSLVFFLSNGVGTYITLQLGSRFYGYGYLASSILMLVTVLIAVDFGIRELDYWTFMGKAKQPDS